jgi:tetratricopeptide (TPR) repeat protein
MWRLGGRVGDRTAEEENRRRALENLDRLPERQRLLIQSREALGEGNVANAILLLEKLIAAYPDEEGAYENLQTIYWYGLGDYEAAVRAGKRGVMALPASGSLRNDLGYSLLFAGRFAEALREFEVYAQLEPEEPNPHDSLGEAYLIIGQPEKAIESFSRALEVNASFHSAHEGKAWGYAMLGRYDTALTELDHAEEMLAGEGVPVTDVLFIKAFLLSRIGRYSEAESLTSNGIQTAERMRTPRRQANYERLTAMLALERQHHAKVLPAANRALEIYTRSTETVSEANRNTGAQYAHMLAGVSEARSGRIDAALAHQHAMNSLYMDERWEQAQKLVRGCLDGEVALAEGDLIAAERAFSAGEPKLKMWWFRAEPYWPVLGHNLPSRDWRARIMKARGEFTGAIEVYRQLLTPDIGDKFVSVLEPRFVLELARLLDEVGEHAEARQEYQRFLDLWKDADPDLPELAGARARLAQLQASDQ